jgi:uncharacterized protein YciI
VQQQLQEQREQHERVLQQQHEHQQLLTQLQ